MYNRKKILAVVTARGGSKRLPNKNILDLGGKPLISWTIAEALKSNYIDELIVSTDSKTIAEVAEEYGANVPFMRPKELSDDAATSVSVLKHAIEALNREFDYIMLLQPTSPLRRVADIDTSIQMLSNETKAVVSVTNVSHSPLWSNTLPADLSMKKFIRDEIKNKRSQDLPPYFRLNGAIYISEIDYFNEINGFIGDLTKAYIMKEERSIDIDSKLDLDFCKLLLERQN